MCFYFKKLLTFIKTTEKKLPNNYDLAAIKNNIRKTLKINIRQLKIKKKNLFY